MKARECIAHSSAIRNRMTPNAGHGVLSVASALVSPIRLTFASLSCFQSLNMMLVMCMSLRGIKTKAIRHIRGRVEVLGDRKPLQ